MPENKLRPLRAVLFDDATPRKGLSTPPMEGISMTIILPFAGGVTAYLAKISNWYRTTSYPCPLCKGKTYRHGKYLRNVYSRDECFIIPIFRRCCPNCEVTFSLIPSFIKPYARFLNSYRFDLLQRHVVE